MEQRVSLITLGVADVSRARSFYERLGWRGQEVQETVFFQAGGLGLVLWHQDKLADDAGLDHVRGEGFRGVNLAHNVRTRGQVDALIKAAKAAGATITRAPADTFYGGYAGHFSDPRRARLGGRVQPWPPSRRRRDPHHPRLRHRVGRTPRRGEEPAASGASSARGTVEEPVARADR